MSGALAAGDTFPDYRVRARNLFRDSANRIHDDAVARTYGYAGGLVAGTTVYAYLTHPLVARWGLDWLGRGTVTVRFRRPVYEGDEVSVRARVAGRSGGAVAGEVAVELEAHTPREGMVAAAVAGLAWGGPPVVPDPRGWPEAPLPAVRRPATPAAVAALDPLGAPALALDEAELARYADGVDDALGVYRGPGAVAHPGLLLQQANRALAENVALGPWVHVGSDVAHCGLARRGDRIATRGRVARVFEKKGRRLAELDLVVVADGDRPVAHVRHTAIYDLGDPGAAGPTRG